MIKERFIVMTAAACMPSSCWGRYGRVGIVELSSEKRPKMISERARGIARIVGTFERQNMGTTERCAFAQSVAAANEWAYQLNKPEDEVNILTGTTKKE